MPSCPKCGTHIPLPPNYQSPRLMVDPTASPLECALDEIVSIMRKYGMVLGAIKDRPGVMLLGKISDGSTQATVLAEIHQINTTHSEWRPVEANSPKAVKIQ